MTAYIAGPISGMPDNNRSRFEAARRLVAARGCMPIVPLDYTREIAMIPCPGVAWMLAMLATRPLLLAADVVFLLPDWVASRGTCDEWRRATEAGIPLIEITEDELEGVYS